MEGVAKTLGRGLSNAVPGPRAKLAAGRAAPALLTGLLVLGALGVLFLRRSEERSARERPGPVLGEAPAAPASPPASDAGARAGARSEALAPAEHVHADPRPAVEPALSSGAPADPREFEGSAALRGLVEIHGDLPAPATWTLSLRPSTTLHGREHAQAREIVFPGDELEFVVPDLPFGGYDVQAVAEGRNGRAMPVLLTRASQNPYIVLELTPASHLEGELRDALGLPAEALALELSSPDGSLRHTAHSDAAGRFRFDGVRDGAYRLFVGDPESPLLPPRALQIAAPGMRLPALELPPLGTLDVFVLDPDGLYVPDAPVRGSGTGGGVLEGRTDADGRIVFLHLLPGRWRLRAEHPLDPERTSARVAVELQAGRSERVELRFVP